jgi:hypothetical protein
MINSSVCAAHKGWSGKGRTADLPLFRIKDHCAAWRRRSTCLLSDPRYTLMDAGVRGCMRLGMRLSSSRTREGLYAEGRM